MADLIASELGAEESARMLPLRSVCSGLLALIRCWASEVIDYNSCTKKRAQVPILASPSSKSLN